MILGQILTSLPAHEHMKNNWGSQQNNISILCDQSALWLGPLLRVIDELRHAGSTQKSNLGDLNENKCSYSTEAVSRCLYEGVCVTVSRQTTLQHC